jgi:DNA-binding response OmpR family regulator/EAL domain-containing protein (putative c-di-GMP-specific phosphodiesterase class I)
VSAQPSAKSLTDLGKTCLLAIRAALGKGFDPSSAAVTNRLLPELALSAEREGHLLLNEAALDVVTYLSSFVDSRARPNLVQLEQLRSLARVMVDELRKVTSVDLSTPAPREIGSGVTGEHPVVRDPAPKPEPTVKAPDIELPAADLSGVPRMPAVLYVHGEHQSVPDLRLHLERRGMRLQSVTTGEEVDAWIERELPVAVLVDVDYFPALPEVIESVEKEAPQLAMRIPVIAMMPKADMPARLQATIGGADALLEAPDAAMVLARLDELLAPPEAEPFRALIVDDDRQQAMFCEAVLKKKGMRTKTAANAEAALKLLESFQPEVLLVDLHMPGANGMELTALVRERAQAVLLPIIFLTGEMDTQTRFDALNVGGDDFFTKPIRPRHLATAVASRIKRARALKRQLASSLSATPPGAALSRSAFLDVLRMSVEGDRHTALLYIAVDQLKGLDDQLGLIALRELEQSVLTQVLLGLKPTDSVTLWQDFCYLALVQRDNVEQLQIAAEAVRAQVCERAYRLAENDGLPLTVCIGMAERGAAQGEAERWLRGARAACQFAHRSGGNLVEAVPTVLPAGLNLEDAFALRELLRQEPSRSTSQLEFQPMVQLRGPHSGQYWQYLRLKDNQPGARSFNRHDYLSQARSTDKLVRLERYAIVQALEVIAEHGQRGKPLRLATHCSSENLLSKLPKWLDDTIGRESKWPGALILAFDAAELVGLSAPQRSLIDALPRPGVRLMLSNYQGTPDQQRLIAALPFSEVELAALWLDHARPEDDLKLLQEKVAGLRKAAKSVIARDLRHVALLSTLWTLGVDYIVADAMRAPGTALDYDFSTGAAAGA